MKKRTLGILFLTALAGLAPATGLVAAPAPSPAPEPGIRAVWLHPGLFGTEEAKALVKMRETLDAYVRAGIDTLIVDIKNTPGEVYYRSKIAVMSPAFSWDFLKVFCEEARARKMTVHPWFCVFPETGILGRVREHPEWLIRDKDGRLIGDANPALPAVRAYERSLMMEVVNNYPVDWIHLDYIRFPCSPAEPYFSFDAETRRLFKAYSGIDIMDVKAHDSGNMIWNEWLEWNRDQVTVFVRELRADLKTAGRPVRISAAVFPNAVNARVLIGQDWPRWAEEGLVDMLCPMLYTNHTEFFNKFVKQAVAVAKGRCSVLPGIGIGSSHNQNTPEGMAEQIRISRELGADGVVFFSGSSLTAPFLEKLATLR